MILNNKIKDELDSVSLYGVVDYIMFLFKGKMSEKSQCPNDQCSVWTDGISFAKLFLCIYMNIFMNLHKCMSYCQRATDMVPGILHDGQHDSVGGTWWYAPLEEVALKTNSSV